MKAAVYHQFRQPLSIETLPDPSPAADGVVLRVEATGLCLSDWHGWMGNEPDIRLPQVPGHEIAGVVEAVGGDVTRWRVGDRVTLPFVGGCGRCPECTSGNHQVCDHQFQPGFGAPGSFAEYVAIPYADTNLVSLPEAIDFVTAASLGCRFATAFRAVVDQGRLAGGEWMAVHGCGGVGLSAIMIGRALGARVLAVDIADDKLDLARAMGVETVINARETNQVPAAIAALSGGGVHLAVDALGSTETCRNAIAGLRKRGRHVQVGLMVGNDAEPAIPMGPVIANELEILGSHGMQAHRYPDMLGMIQAGLLQPEKLVGQTIGLKQAAERLPSMNEFREPGITVITPGGDD